MNEQERLALEPERYELHEDHGYRFELARRDFLKVVGGGLVIVLFLDRALARQESGRGGRLGGPPLPKEIAAWLHVAEDGTITVYTGKAEVGQDIRTSLSLAVADEIHAPLASIHLVMGDTSLTPYDMGTFGSRTTPGMAPQLRRVAAAAREALLDKAAEQLAVERATLTIADGTIRHAASGRALSFGQVTRGEKLVRAIGDDATMTPPEKWSVAGKPTGKVNGRAIVTGEELFVSDVKQDGLRVGKVLRPESFGAKLASVDTTAAAAIPDVTVVRDGEFVGVAAPDELVAARAISLIRAKWEPTPQPAARELFDWLKKNPAEGGGFGGRSDHNKGSMDEGLAAAEQKAEAAYTIAYIAHVPLEPRAAVATWEGDRLTVWTGTQRPFGVRGELAQAFAIAEDHVRVIVPATGSGYGGKHTGEAAVEAARLARAAGKPVRVSWTREEEFASAYFRPAGLIEVKSGARKDGTITAWEFHNWNSGSSGIETPYDVANQRIEFHATRTPLRQGSYRGLAATANHFARESHMDEIATAIGMDPLEFRLKNLRDERIKNVLTAAAERFGWKSRKGSAGRGSGVACGTEKGGFVATCAEVGVDATTGRVSVVRAVTAFECGAIVNPDLLQNQVEGAVIMGLGGALFEAIDFDGGKIKNGRLSDYRVPRFSDVPAMETVLLDRKDIASAGAGETPIVAIAPAIGNAIFAATGTRLRSLPLVPSGVRAAPSDSSPK
ncbi:MAG: xanthine dehydrogenase family protein molybdopterin-binding subunit [Planctomycetes bacterium]|nr:xanthine dehydrogenase family protein molybdopterin-binding subunit [Planctomycetota bacterium]MBI3848196.1 xanthine dehydrogenase family protein molybdopterin-binding subunit [Planctomycetota bacterium]